MAVLNGATVFQTVGNPNNLRSDAIGKNSEVFASGDPVMLSSGVLAVVTGTNAIVGVVVKKVTMASDNQTVAKVAPSYIPSDNQTIFLMGTNADLTGNATDPGTYYKLTGTTGAVKVDVASGVQVTSSRQVEIVKVDPRNVGGTGAGSGLREVLVRFVSTPYSDINIQH